MKKPSAVYVYCVARCPRAPALERAPRGLPGTGPARIVEVGRSLWLVVADAPLALYGQESIERGLRDLDWVGKCAAGHERVVEHVALGCTAVPMKLFTLFGGDERAVAHVRKIRARIDRIADRIEGCLEWGVRVTVDERRARQIARQRTAPKRSRSGAGTSFLLSRKAEHDGVGEALRLARRDVGRAFSDLADRARASVQRPPVSREVAARVLLDAVFLVPTRTARDFEAAVTRATASLSKSGCAVTLTGPWPPYHFVDLRGRRAAS